MKSLPSEMDERGVAHLTASLVVNRAARDDPVIYLARGTVFNSEKMIQGFATDAQHYHGKLVQHKGDRRLSLRYGDWELVNFPIEHL